MILVVFVWVDCFGFGLVVGWLVLLRWFWWVVYLLGCFDFGFWVLGALVVLLCFGLWFRLCCFGFMCLLCWFGCLCARFGNLCGVISVVVCVVVVCFVLDCLCVWCLFGFWFGWLLFW